MNHLPKHILSRKYFENTIHVNIQRSLFMCRYSCITIHVNSTPPQVVVHANYPTLVPLCEPEIHGHFRPHTHQHTIYFINYETNTQTASTQSQTVQMGSKNSPKISTIWSQVLGPIKLPFKVSNQPKHYKTLKQSVTSSRIKPLPHGVCRNSNFWMSTRSSHCIDQLCLQSRQKPAI